jgi:transcriptional regulator with GAF, ATPase, and Fis domain
MSAHLIAVRGPFRGRSFALRQGELSIGRAGVNDVCLEDTLVSRRHCGICGDAEQFTIVDFGSQNGTFVNSLPVAEHRLTPGERIEIGGSMFVFARDEHPLTYSFSDPEQLLTAILEGQTRAHPDRPLSLLLKLSSVMDYIRALHAARHIRDQRVFERVLLALIFDLLPAERGAVILLREQTRQFEKVPVWDRSFGQTQYVIIEADVAKRVVGAAVPVLKPRSDAGVVLCVPLVEDDNVMGMIYLESSPAGFGEDDLQLMVAVARFAAVALENARQMEWLEWQNRHLEDTGVAQHSMLGKSPRMKEVYDFITRVAPTDSTVLIRGESGTGKELVARALHANSRRRAKPFVTLNCSALPEALLESELFGHEKGAFTGAVTQKKGILEVADRGTVFLDEIGELALPQQAKLLRAIERHEFFRLGAAHPTQVDVRVIAATNRNLNDAVNSGAFRADLYFRINVVSITLPPLRERREDIPLLASFYLQHFSSKYNAGVKGISRRAQSALVHNDWPGNVRELQNAIERAVVLGTSDVIQPEDLPESVLEGRLGEEDLTEYHAAIREKKKELIVNAIKIANGSYTEAAKVLGVHPNYLHRLVNNLGLRGHIRDRTS